MKVIRNLTSALAIIALTLSAWAIYSLSSDDSNKIEAGLNFVYFTSLLVGFFCFRVTIAANRKVNPIVLIITLLITVFSTHIWLKAPALLTLGNINLGLISLLIGITTMILVKSNSKLSKVAQLIIGVTAVAIASSAFLQIEQSLFYTITMTGLVLSSIFTITALATKKTS